MCDAIVFSLVADHLAYFFAAEFIRSPTKRLPATLPVEAIMSLLKRKSKTLPAIAERSNTNVLQTSSSSEEETIFDSKDRISLSSHDVDDENEDNESNPYIEGEKSYFT